VRGNEDEGQDDQEPEAYVEKGEEDGRKVVEDDRADEPADEGDILLHMLTGGEPQPVLPLRKRAENPRKGFEGDEYHGDEVNDPEGEVTHRTPSQQSADEYDKLSSDCEGHVEQVKCDYDVGKQRRTHRLTSLFRN